MKKRGDDRKFLARVISIGERLGHCDKLLLVVVIDHGRYS